MRQHLHSARDRILPLIDFFYPVFRRFMPLQTFRYAVSGAGNTFLGLLAYYITYKFILRGQDFHFGFYALKSHVAALAMSFVVSFLVGFFLMKYVVFDDSKIKGRVQLFRYLLVCVFNLTVNLVLLKFLVEVCGIYPVFAQIGTTVVVVLLSYLAQRHFSFKRVPEPTYLEDDRSDSGSSPDNGNR
ncbi:GtrA family protein [Niabella drilacis]|uniref:Putative flippase GtrA (Transmembrane translocase of bactoprenol-linked glucose) n=1 Tax=Niabella drilacis (strain DSM 25811 / CCM 8410 / CCUG 62505 / LMG 26954 / E90) TaxID=1285928 RepID=A0A1G7BYK3_NIADE|nr:GtrA family protein [Niabella drilacis]SDE32119.1 Putative flippase GtrA (transmembrane translocase of bactoprenol-linked glucose) [Niabella drilacis]